MTAPGQDWNELTLSEEPATKLLEKLGYHFVAADKLDAERASSKDVLLVPRLAAALRRINPWMTEEHVQKAIRDLSGVQATSLLEASQIVHGRLTGGTTATASDARGQRDRDVFYFDFRTPKNNAFLVTRQFVVQGAKKKIIPDIVLFVNGIPLAVIECKSPTLGEKWSTEALEQLTRYQELEERFRELGAPRLFETVQILVATCGEAALCGTITTPGRFFAEWKTSWPRKPAEVEALAGRQRPQEITIAGLLAPEHLLDVLQNFVAFDHDSAGRMVRKICRYQQFTAVNKAIERAKKGNPKKPSSRGGVVWHTQGSGKSLSMLWLALKLRRDPTHENPTLVLVTDRKDLDDQIRKTFENCRFPNPERATSVKHLRELLEGTTGKTVLTTVQKFQALAAPGTVKDRRGLVRPSFGVLSNASNIFVLTDEAHRTQYGTLAANMRASLPNAAFFGFTGTPIDKKDRSTLDTFGDYIDQYTIEQAVADRATVQIVYESRLPDLRILGNNLDDLFDRVFADRTAEEREAIKKKYTTQEAIAGAPSRVKAVCLDIIQHYETTIRPGGFKAQIVACNRDTAALYAKTLELLQGPPARVIISVGHKEEADVAAYRMTDTERKKVIERFLDKRDPLAILIVCDMLLTGFDAPIEQVMYLDAPLREHTLLQAIARVNRVADDKRYGLVVDYWGVSEALEDALSNFVPGDVKGAMTPKSDELPRLEIRHAAALRFFTRVKDRDDLQACIASLAAEDVRSEFDVAFRKFSQSLDMLLPDPRALRFVDDARWLGKIRQGAAVRYRDRRLDISDCGPKVRKLIEEAIAAEGIEILVREVALFSPEFQKKLAALQSDEARASEMEHAIRHEIHVRIDEDPVFFGSLRAQLEQIIGDKKARRIDAARQLELEGIVAGKLRSHDTAAEQIGLTGTGLAIYGLVAQPPPAHLAEPKGKPYERIDPATLELVTMLEEQLAPHLGIVDWVQKEDVQKDMRKLVKRQLRIAHFPEDRLETMAHSIVDLLKLRHGR